MINAEWTNIWMEKNLPTLITQQGYELADTVVHKSQEEWFDQDQLW